MSAKARPMFQEPRREPDGELRDAMRLGDKTVDELLEAQKQHLEAATPQVHPLVWKEALKAAGGDISRIAVHSYTEVYVLNSGDKLPASLLKDSA